MVVQPLNARQVYLISQVLLRNDILNNCTLLLERITAIMGTPGMWKTSDITSLVTETFSILEDRGTSVLLAEQMRRRWINHRIGMVVFNPVENFHVSDSIWHSQMQKTLSVAPTDNAVVVLQNRLQRVIPVFDQR